VRTSRQGERIQVELTHGLDASLYDLPLTLETQVPAEWTAVEVRQGRHAQRVDVVRDGRRAVVRYRAVPNAGTVALVAAP
jgi:hypothetical protein